MSAKHIAGMVGLSGASSSVTIDVYSELGTFIGTITNPSLIHVGVTTSYLVDLRSNNLVDDLALPKDGAPEEKTYVLVWKDDAAHAFHSFERVEGQRSRGEPGRMFHQETAVYPSTTIPSRGITSEILAQEKPSYIKHEFAPDQDFGSVQYTFYDVLFYDASGRVQRRAPSLSPPSP